MNTLWYLSEWGGRGSGLFEVWIYTGAHEHTRSHTFTHVHLRTHTPQLLDRIQFHFEDRLWHDSTNRGVAGVGSAGISVCCVHTIIIITMCTYHNHRGLRHRLRRGLRRGLGRVFNRSLWQARSYGWNCGLRRGLRRSLRCVFNRSLWRA